MFIYDFTSFFIYRTLFCPLIVLFFSQSTPLYPRSPPCLSSPPLPKDHVARVKTYDLLLEGHGPGRFRPVVLISK